MKNNKTLIVSSNIYLESEDFLEKAGYQLIKITPQPYFNRAISSHPDMFISSVRNKIFYDGDIHDLLTFCLDNDSKNLFIKVDREAIVGESIKYPFDVEFNCVSIGNKLICNINHTSKHILEFCKSNEIEILNVNQGYAKCSTCVVSDKAIITEDESIFKCAQKNNIDVLKIEKGHVLLDGYNYGFIGGCSGLIDEKLLAFNGSIDFHPQSKLIYDFCFEHGVDVVNLCEKQLFDIGSIIKVFKPDFRE